MSDAVAKIQRGEKVNGWKSYRTNTTRPYYQLLLPPWPKDGSEVVDTSVLAYAIEQASIEAKRKWIADGNYYRYIFVSTKIYIIRRYSLIAPGLYDDIVRISYESNGCCDSNGWRPVMQCFINEDVVAIGWNRYRRNEIRIVLVNIKSKSGQIVDALSPRRNANMKAIFIDSTSGHLMVLFTVPVPFTNNFAHHLSEFKITPSESNRSPTVHQVSTRQAWPEGTWFFETSQFGCSFPGAFYFMRNFVTADTRVVSMDRDGIHDLFNAYNWFVEFERSAVGIPMLKAKGGLGNLGQMFELHRSHLFAYVSPSRYVHRPLFQPSMWYRAAEALCLANPNVDFAKVKKEIGLDIFDGILDRTNAIDFHMVVPSDRYQKVKKKNEQKKCLML